MTTPVLVIFLVAFIFSVSATRFFPSTSVWYQDVSTAALDTESDIIINAYAFFKSRANFGLRSLGSLLLAAGAHVEATQLPVENSKPIWASEFFVFFAHYQWTLGPLQYIDFLADTQPGDPTKPIVKNTPYYSPDCDFPVGSKRHSKLSLHLIWHLTDYRSYVSSPSIWRYRRTNWSRR